MKKIREIINRIDSLMPEDWEVDGVKQAKLSNQLLTILIMIIVFLIIVL